MHPSVNSVSSLADGHRSPSEEIGEVHVAAVSARTVVLGAAVGYSAEQISPFLLSLRACGYDGAIALLVDAEHEREFRLLPLFSRVALIRAPKWLPMRWRGFRHKSVRLALWFPLRTLLWLAIRIARFLPLPPKRRVDLQMRAGHHLYPPAVARYFHYFRFLLEGDYERIVIADVRDVLFQVNPFDALPRDGLAVSVEVPAYTIATQGNNAEWIGEAYGASALERLGDRPVSCSGVTYGDRVSMRRYLELMVRDTLTLNFRASRLFGMDQGIHNYLLWTGQFGEFQLLETFKSPVATLNTVAREALTFSEEGRLLNEDGSTISIVHQYDRVPQLTEMLLDALVGPQATFGGATHS